MRITNYNMKIINKNTLNTKELTAAKELEALCRNTDKLTGSLFLSPELNENESIPCFFLLYEEDFLAAFLSIFMPSLDEAYVTVCTHPEKRRQGLCTLLLKKAAALLNEYDIDSMIFMVEPGATAFLTILDKIGANLLNSEYIMTYNNSEIVSTPDSRYELIPAKGKSIKSHISLHHRAFATEYDESSAFINELFNDEYIKAFSFKDTAREEIIGACYVDTSSSRLIILGVCIDPVFRNRGLGKLMMEQLLSKYAISYGRPISLQVSGNNGVAKQLYEKLGFTVTSQLDYLIISSADISDTPQNAHCHNQYTLE